MKKDLDHALETANQILSTAFELKETARKSKKDFKLFFEASKKFKEASEAYKDLVKKTTNENDKESMQLYSEYYIHESLSCKSAYFYEKGDIAHALTLLEEADAKLDLLLTDGGKIASKDPTILKNIKKWEFHKYCNKANFFAYKGRENFRNGRYIEALDNYQQAIDASKECVVVAEKKVMANELEQVYLRISNGNVCGMYFNLTNSFAGILLNHIENTFADSISLKMKLFDYLIDGLDFSHKAFKANPEWKEYVDGIESYNYNINIFLENNKDLWLNIFEKYNHLPEVRSVMKRIDLKKYNEYQLQDNKPIKIWSIGGFFIFSLGIIFLLVFIVFYNFSLINAFLICVLAEILFLIMGAFILRTSGDLSEGNMMELIKMALKIQFRISNFLSKKEYP